MKNIENGIESQKRQKQNVNQDPIEKDLYCIHCSTESEANLLFSYWEKLGYQWLTGEPIFPNNTLWELHKKETCYRIVQDFRIVVTTLEKYHASNLGKKPVSLVEYMQPQKVHAKNRSLNATKKEDPLQGALQVLSKLVLKEQERCDKWNTEEMIGASNAYKKCMNFLDELVKNPVEFAQKYQYASGIIKIESGDVVEIGENKTRVLVTEIYKDKVPKCCIGTGLNLDNNFTSVSISSDVPVKKIGHTDLQNMINSMMQENISQDTEEFERE